MKTKVIYDNQSSSLTAESDGETIQLTQMLDGEIIGVISVYIDELEEAVKFAKEAN